MPKDFSDSKVSATCTSLIQLSSNQLYDGSGQTLPVSIASGTLVFPRLEAPNAATILPVMLSGTSTGLTSAGIQVDGNIVKASKNVLGLSEQTNWIAGDLAYATQSGLRKGSGIEQMPLQTGANTQSLLWSESLYTSNGNWLTVVMSSTKNRLWSQSPFSLSNGIADGPIGSDQGKPTLQLKLWDQAGVNLNSFSLDVPNLDLFKRIELSLYGGTRNSIDYYYTSTGAAYSSNLDQPVCNAPVRTVQFGKQTTAISTWNGSKLEIASILSNRPYICPIAIDSWLLLFKQDAVNYKPMTSVQFFASGSTIGFSQISLAKGGFGFGCQKLAPAMLTIEDSFTWGEYSESITSFADARLPSFSLSGAVIGFGLGPTLSQVLVLAYDKYLGAIVTRLSTLGGTTSGYISNLSCRLWHEGKAIPKVRLYSQVTGGHIVVWEAPDGLRIATISNTGAVQSQRLFATTWQNWALLFLTSSSSQVPIVALYNSLSGSIDLCLGSSEGLPDTPSLSIVPIVNSPIVDLIAGQSGLILAKHKNNNFVTVYAVAIDTSLALVSAKLIWLDGLSLSGNALAQFSLLDPNGTLTKLPDAPAQPCGIAIDSQSLALSGKVSSLNGSSWGKQVGSLGWLV